jgi:hypothetical protein
MSSIGINALAPYSAQSIPQASSDVRKQPAAPVTGGGTVNPVEIVIAGATVSESTILAIIRDAVEGGKLAVARAGTSVAKIEGVLIDLLKLVTSGEAATDDPGDVQRRAETLLATTNDAVTEATVRGVNLIAGGAGGAVTTTKFTTMRGLDGRTVTVGGAGVAAMNASAAGLGLASFVASGRGAMMVFHVSADNIIVGGDNPTAIRLQTINYGDSLAETPRFPGRSWIFRFTPGSLPAVSTETPRFDITGNLLRLDAIVAAPLSLNFTPDDAVAALGSAMNDRGFEISIAQDVTTVNVLRIAGNNIDVAAVTAQNVNLSASPTELDENIDVGPDLSTVTRAVHPQDRDNIDVATITAQHVNLSASPTELDENIDVGPDLSAVTPAFHPQDRNNLSRGQILSEPLAARPPLPVAGPEMTTANTDAAENAGTVSSMSMRDIPAASDLASSSHLPAVIVTSWEGPDAAIATLTSAMRKADVIAQALGGHIVILNELQHSLPDETDMMIASESLYLGSALAKSDATLAAAQLQRRLAGEPSDLSDQMAQLLLRFFQWRRDHSGHKPSEIRSSGRRRAGDARAPGDHDDGVEEIADEPFLEPGELDDEST